MSSGEGEALAHSGTWEVALPQCPMGTSCKGQMERCGQVRVGRELQVGCPFPAAVQTEQVRAPPETDVWLSTEAVEIGKSVSMLMLGYDGERNLVVEADEFTLARKVAKEEIGARTANRHR